jgi:hypothetical protein
VARVYGSLGIYQFQLFENSSYQAAPEGRSGQPSQVLSDRCRLGLRVALPPLLPVLARTQGAYTTNFFRTESPISEAGDSVNGVAGRLKPAFARLRLSRGVPRIWMAGRSFAKVTFSKQP